MNRHQTRGGASVRRGDERATRRWPLTGRDDELDRIGELTTDPECGGVVLLGAAGVGKTRLADEAVRRAEGAGLLTARAVAHPTTQQIPLGALAHLIPPELVNDVGVGADERAALFHRVHHELRALAADRRLVLLVDDLDLLDDTSAALLVPLVVDRRIFLIGTVRSARSPGARLAGLQRDGHLHRIDLDPLGREQLQALMHHALAEPVTPRSLDAFERVSGGNLQILTELVRAAVGQGDLVHTTDGWDLRGPLSTSAALDELVAEHLDLVDDAGMAILQTLSMSEPLGVSLLEALHGGASLEQLEDDGLIVVTESGRRTAVRLAHPLYGETLRDRLPPLRRRSILRRLADQVDAYGARRREDQLHVPLWRLDSGGRPADGFVLRAARLALLGREPGLAERLATPPFSDAATTTQQGQRLQVLGEATATTGRVDQAEHHFRAALDLELPDELRAQLAARHAALRFFALRDLDGALATCDMALEQVSDSRAAATVLARRATILANAGHPGDALRTVERLPHDLELPNHVEATTARAVSLISLGRCDEAATLARTAASAQAELPPWSAQRGAARHVLNEAHALAYVGRFTEARALVEPAAERSLASGAIAGWVWFEMTLGEIARDRGRGAEAVRRCNSVVSAAASAGQDAVLVWAHVGVAQGHLLLGRCDEAGSALARADAIESPVATSIGTRDRTHGWLLACRGDLPAARMVLEGVAEAVRADEVYLFEAAVRHDLARFGDAGSVVERLHELAGIVDGPQVQAFWIHARALAERDAHALAQSVDLFEQMDSLCYAAEAAAELAELHAATGDQRAAIAAQRRSTNLADRAGGAATPPLVRGRGIDPLTAREREVALLAASGLSSSDIGRRLHVSTRTVDSHLGRVYRKLGISRRDELAAAMHAGLE